MIRFRPLPVLTLCAIAALVLLMLTGRWQWHKYETKRAALNAPVSEMSLENYQPIVEGLQFVYAISAEGEAGWRVFAPVRAGDQVVFVDAAFIAELTPPNWREMRYPPSLEFNAPVAGAPLRPGPRPALVQPDRPLERLWFHVDLAAMGRTAGVERVADYYLAIPYVGADGRAQPNPFAASAGADPLPPERHMGYAFTWWGLAAVLVAVYFAFHVNVGRLSFAQSRRDDSGEEL